MHFSIFYTLYNFKYFKVTLYMFIFINFVQTFNGYLLKHLFDIIEYNSSGALSIFILETQ